MLGGLPLLLLVFASQALGGSVQPLPALPAGTFANAIQVDSSGNIYVAGYFTTMPQDIEVPAHAFIGKLSPDGSQVIWSIILAGSMDDRVYAMALGSDGSVYVTGTTYSDDFPTTPFSLQPTTTVFSDPYAEQAFAAKLDPKGAVVYSTYIGGSATTWGNAIAVDSGGHAFLTGLGAVSSTTPGSIEGAGSVYIVELDPGGSSALVAINGFGGDAIAVDAQGNIYAAGSFPGQTEPTSFGAFQATNSARTCFSTFLFQDTCTYQHIAKIDPTGTRLIYATYISGTWGATPSAIAVDASGNAILAGNTFSPDYPTTPGSYQPEYFADPEQLLEPIANLSPPSPAGYVTKLNASGTALLWSTFLAGSGYPNTSIGDSIAAMATDESGNVLIAGLVNSTDLPGLWATPVASRPSSSPLNFVARLSSDGSTLSPTQLLPSSTVGGAIAVRADGTAIFGLPLAAVSLSSVGRVAAISDSADYAKLVSVAPGQLLTLYGTGLAPRPAQPSNGFPTSFNGVTVTFNGIAAPILYTSGIQINLQVPYEVAGQSEVTMQVTSDFVSPPVSESYILAVVQSQPSVFVSPVSFSQPIFDIATCKGQNVGGLQPLAFNADGTLNSCTNPAAQGSTVTVFLNGLGVTNPPQVTGALASSSTPVSPSAVPGGQLVLLCGPVISFCSGSSPSVTVLSTNTVPNTIASVAQVRMQVNSAYPFLNVPLLVEQESVSSTGVTTVVQNMVRGPGILIWLMPAK
jgi:uncharacterized protein (TIGR03437 family)